MSKIPRRLRSRVVARAGNRCEYCRFPARGQPGVFPVDHIRPRSRGGRTVLSNLAFACPWCNQCKADHVRAADPATGKRVPLFNPRTQSWDDHFQWSLDDPFLLECKSATGRATVACLQMNHPEMVFARSLRAILEWFHDPPE